MVRNGGDLWNVGHSGSFSPESAFLTAEVLLILVTNLTFLWVLFRLRRSINWKSTVFVANIAVSDVLCAFSLLATLIYRYSDHGQADRWATSEEARLWPQSSVHIITTFSVGITVFNYNALFFVQDFSVRRPIAYRTQCSKRRFVVIIVSQWLLVAGYCTLKTLLLHDLADQTYFFRAELVLMGLSIVVNAITYGHVLFVAVRNQMSKLKRINQISSVGESQQQPQMQQQQKRTSWPVTALWTAVSKDYRSIVTAGFHLLIYVATFAPLWLVKVDVAVNGCENSDRNLYTCFCDSCRATLYVWYARAIFDPVLQMIREPKFHSPSKILCCWRSSSRPRSFVSSTASAQQLLNQ